MDPGVLDLSARALFFPVRHHSPACAAAVRDLIFKIRPAAVLIEGPSDFTERIPELLLAHTLPIAIYSWVGDAPSTPQAVRNGAFYPFCVYSPEWQALLAATQVGARLEFIDLPWHQLAQPQVKEFANSEPAAQFPGHRYAEPELHGSAYVARLCAKLGSPDLDALWDSLFEVEPLPVPDLWERLHLFCHSVRECDRNTSARDLEREAFMVTRVERALASCSGSVLVVTGGFHSYALYARLHGLPFDHNPVGQPESATNPDQSAAARQEEVLSLIHI